MLPLIGRKMYCDFITPYCPIYNSTTDYLRQITAQRTTNSARHTSYATLDVDISSNGTLPFVSRQKGNKTNKILLKYIVAFSDFNNYVTFCLIFFIKDMEQLNKAYI